VILAAKIAANAEIAAIKKILGLESGKATTSFAYPSLFLSASAANIVAMHGWHTTPAAYSPLEPSMDRVGASGLPQTSQTM
jgi:hypothetical protein